MVAMTCGSFKHVVEHELGRLPSYVIYALLEWVLIGILLLDGFLAFFAHEFAKLFELETPCTLCSRIDHVFIHRNTLLFYNELVCEGHKLQISTLAYCHAHKKLADSRTLCKGCLHGGDTNSGIKMSLCDDKDEHSNACSCCGNKVNKSCYQQKLSLPNEGASGAWKKEKPSALKRSHSKLSLYTTPADEEGGNVSVSVQGIRSPDNDDSIEQHIKTPPSMKTNRLNGILISSDSACSSPRFANRTPKKSMLDRMELGSADPFDNIGTNEPEDSIINRLKMQLKMDRKSLSSLQMELNEERNAAAEAANNAMSMITRLQTEKAALQMEALQYKRMMDEQSEYDQEALLSLKDLLDKREDEMRDLEMELELYKEKYGAPKDGIRHHRMERSQSFASFNDRFDKPSLDFGAFDNVAFVPEIESDEPTENYTPQQNAGDINDAGLLDLSIGSGDEATSNIDKEIDTEVPADEAYS